MNVKEIRRKNLRALARGIGGVTQLANRLEKSQSQISHLIGTNPVKNIGDKFAAHVERIFNKPIGWLDHEQTAIGEEAGIYDAGLGRANIYRVPLIAWQEVPELLAKSENSDIKNRYSQMITHVKVSQHAFALHVEGDSMEAPHGVSFPNGSIIIVDPEHTVVSGSFVLAKQNATNQVVFKQFVIDGNRRYLKPLNPRYPIIEITPQAIICGVVRVLVMEFK